MTEEEARAWLAALAVPRETVARLEAFVALVLAENQQQNLIARSTEAAIWGRHVVDSAQLAGLADVPGGPWLDIGAGPGFPGIVIALMTDAPVWLVEPRRLRAAFLSRASRALGLEERVKVFAEKIEAAAIPAPPRTVTARAYAPLDRIFAVCQRFAGPETIYVLPKGRGAADELESARRTWQGTFHVERSVTDRDAAIVVARAVRRRKAR
ncbi:16S rRNA (guanine(527)-N(7))-methyltransferase RsmG [Sphingomonas flavalba]|uniref:16S rRNA (guanine(527)-N(7))-methyltransferase RsmG n=1 Tax=Sphingomonas flavalba TaxID=2559804 RepID=UPI00109DB058|nr:16S rRNA (guanine(527)-N(7))-methyltransferase RsmG [Sphingomonas flavalba]